MTYRLVEAGEFMARRNRSVNPAKFPDEEFELHSIPAFDAGQPEMLSGREIGSSKQIVLPNDVMISKIVPHIRRSSVVGPATGRRQIASSEWIVFRTEDLFPNYLRHLLVSDEFNAKFMRTVSGVGGSLLRARPAEVAKIKIPIPPLSEQRRIAAILDKADALRAKRREAIAKLDQLLQSVFLDMFGDPVTNPKNWPVRDLSEAADFITGHPFKSAAFLSPGEGIKLCRGTNVLPSSLDWTEEAIWNREDIVRFERYRLFPGDVVVAMDRPWISSGFKIHLFSDDDPECLLVQRVARLRPSAHFKPNYLYTLFASDAFKRHCKPTETTIPHISPNDFRSFPVLDPGKSKIDHFECIASSVASHAKSLSRGLFIAERLFGSVQRKAFSDSSN